VRQALAWGDIAPIETASAACPEALRLWAIARGLLQAWANAFPAPRRHPARGLAVLLPAHRAARVAGRYARRHTGDVRRAARVFGAVGARVAGVEPAQGVAVRGPSADPRLSGAVVRQRLVQRAPPAARRQPGRRPPQAPPVAGTGRQRAARRAIQQGVEAAAAAARAQQGAGQGRDWDTPPVGGTMLQYARLGTGRRLHRLATPQGEGS
jgi:hypothetical protein